MPAWFDLMSLDPSGPEDEKGIEKSSTNLTKIIDEEINNGIDPSRIVIGGFSQGGALAIYMGLTGKHTVYQETWVLFRSTSGSKPFFMAWWYRGSQLLATVTQKVSGSGKLRQSQGKDDY